MSIWNTRFRRCAQVIGARGWSASTRLGARRGTMRLQPGQQRIVRRLVQRRYAVQGQCLAPGLRSNGDAVGNGSRLQVVEAGIGHQVQTGVIRIGYQQAAAFQHAHDAAAEAVEQASEFIAGGPAERTAILNQFNCTPARTLALVLAITLTLLCVSPILDQLSLAKITDVVFEDGFE
jgi:hypothetical protein